MELPMVIAIKVVPCYHMDYNVHYFNLLHHHFNSPPSFLLRALYFPLSFLHFIILHYLVFNHHDSLVVNYPLIPPYFHLVMNSLEQNHQLLPIPLIDYHDVKLPHLIHLFSGDIDCNHPS